jgi:hypothetical protein
MGTFPPLPSLGKCRRRGWGDAPSSPLPSFLVVSIYCYAVYHPKLAVKVWPHGATRKGIVTVCLIKNKSTLSFKILEPKIRLTRSYQGYLQIKQGSTWINVNEENWDVKREKMLCQHLGFKETDAKDPKTIWVGSRYKIAIGDLICYNTQPSGTSCCVHLVPSIPSSNVPIPFARCEYDISITIVK